MASSHEFHWAEGMKYVTEGVKIQFLMNGGAAIGILTFIGNAGMKSGWMITSLFLFALGCAATAVAFALCYLTQLFYGNHALDPNSGHYLRAGTYHKSTYGAVICSLLFFIMGISCAAYGFWTLEIPLKNGYFCITPLKYWIASLCSQ